MFHKFVVVIIDRRCGIVTIGPFSTKEKAQECGYKFVEQYGKDENCSVVVSGIVSEIEFFSDPMNN